MRILVAGNLFYNRLKDFVNHVGNISLQVKQFEKHVIILLLMIYFI